MPTCRARRRIDSATNGTSLAANTTCRTPSSSSRSAACRRAASPNGTTTVNLLDPASVYGDRITQVDMRFAKILRFGGTRADIGIDLYNLFNTNDATGFEQTFDYGDADGASGCGRRRSWRRGSRGSTSRSPFDGSDRMKRGPRRVTCVVIVWLLSASEVTVNDAVSVIVSPQVANEPARIKVRVLVEPDSDNRALELVTESANFFRRSHVQLDGD